MSSDVTWSASSTAHPNVAVDHSSAVADNTTDDFHNYMPFDEISSLLAETVQIILIITGLIGVVVNGFVLFALFALKEFRKNTTNVFIGNQSVLDAVACIALTATMLVQKTSASDYAVGFNKRILCWFFDNMSFLGAAVHSSNFSLVVIALERYFKVVHPVKYRNILRPWMVKVGIIAPWLDGLSLIIIPIGLTSNVVDGVCHTIYEKPEPSGLYISVLLVSHCLFPLAIFIFCYSKIIAVVRRQTQIVSGTVQMNGSRRSSFWQSDYSGIKC
jgi:hypothetical protein